MSETALFDAIERKDLETARELIAGDPELVHARDDVGATPLHHAAYGGLCELALLLLDAGADVNAVDGRFGATPAGWAIEYLRERDGLLGIEIADAKLAIERGDVEWLERWLTRFPALKTARDASGRLLSEIAKSSGSAAVSDLF